MWEKELLLMSAFILCWFCRKAARAYCIWYFMHVLFWTYVNSLNRRLVLSRLRGTLTHSRGNGFWNNLAINTHYWSTLWSQKCTGIPFSLKLSWKRCANLIFLWQLWLAILLRLYLILSNNKEKRKEKCLKWLPSVFYAFLLWKGIIFFYIVLWQWGCDTDFFS